MRLKTFAMDSFILLRASWPVELARLLLVSTQATHVIIHRMEPDLYALVKVEGKIDGDVVTEPGGVKDYYYLHTVAAAKQQLAGKPSTSTVFEAFDLHEYGATTTLDAYAAAETAPDRVVVTDRDQVVGFYDVDVRPESYKRGATEGSTKPELRQLTAEFPEQIPLNAERSLLVSLSAIAAAAPGQSVAHPLDIAIGTSLTLLVQPRRGFSLVGDGEVTFVVTEKEDLRQFSLKAMALGPGEVRILAFSGGQCLCTIILKPTVSEAGQVVNDVRSAEMHPVEVKLVPEPDLSLLILEGEAGGKPTLTFRLKALDPALKLNFTRWPD